MGKRRDDITVMDRMQIGLAMLAPHRVWGEVRGAVFKNRLVVHTWSRT
jgi:hypothetical protein